MAVYHGIVKGNVVVLPDDVRLADGTDVEVRVIEPGDQPGGHQRSEKVFKQRLLESGLITSVRTPLSTLPRKDRTPAQVHGQPLSEVILGERR
jgi:hypothetical protein